MADHDPRPEEVHASDRRTFLKRASGYVGLSIVTPALLRGANTTDVTPPAPEPTTTGALQNRVTITLKVNGAPKSVQVEPRMTLLDTLRDHLEMPGTKKGCDHGTCGACTVWVDGQRVLSCLTLAVMAQGKDITTIEGLAQGDKLHPVQEAFVACDGFQCGFCTPGQIMSAAACIKEGHTHDDGEIREWMSGNICRCAAYPNILAAVKQAAAAGGTT